MWVSLHHTIQQLFISFNVEQRGYNTTAFLQLFLCTHHKARHQRQCQSCELGADMYTRLADWSHSMTPRNRKMCSSSALSLLHYHGVHLLRHPYYSCCPCSTSALSNRIVLKPYTQHALSLRPNHDNHNWRDEHNNADFVHDVLCICVSPHDGKADSCCKNGWLNTHTFDTQQPPSNTHHSYSYIVDCNSQQLHKASLWLILTRTAR